MSVLEKVSAAQAVLVSSLKLVDEIDKLGKEWEDWAKGFFVEKQCFSNALNMSVIDHSSVVLGYVYLYDFGLAVEHAWNRYDGRDFDLTAQLFWTDSPCAYVELVTFSPDEAIELAEQGGIHHMALRMSERYGSLFR